MSSGVKEAIVVNRLGCKEASSKVVEKFNNQGLGSVLSDVQHYFICAVRGLAG